MASIVVIDDDVTVREFFRGVFSGLGYDVYDSFDGTDTIEVLKTIHPDILLVDIMMPQMDGYQLIETIRSFDPMIPIIVVSGISKYDARDRVLALGANEFFEKPPDLDALHAAIKKHTDGPSMNKEMEKSS